MISKLPSRFILAAFAAAAFFAHNVEARSLHNLRTVIIDPGHGGRDFGAKSPNLALEKDATRKLARALKETIEEQNGKKVKVVLTHSGVSETDQVGRSFVAGNLKGDIYISLHAASGFDQSSRNLGIYIWEKDKSPGGSWKDVNKKHRTASLVLSEKLRKNLTGFYPHKSFFVRSGRLLSLYGIDMPAAVIEVIALNDPKDEIRLNAAGFYKRLSAALYSALIDYDRNL